MAEAMEAEYVELANTQYYGWAYVNRDQLLPTREQVERAEEVTNRFRERIGSKMRVFFVVPDYLRGAPEGLHERLGRGVPHRHRRRSGATLPRGAPAAGPQLSQRARPRPGLDLVRIARVQRLPRRRLDEGALPLLPGKGQGLRRLPLPGLSADRRRHQCRSGVRPVAQSPPGHRGAGEGAAAAGAAADADRSCSGTTGIRAP